MEESLTLEKIQLLRNNEYYDMQMTLKYFVEIINQQLRYLTQ
ncbi:MAG: hypothetical protein RSB70_03335 [Clostridium sp.]